MSDMLNCYVEICAVLIYYAASCGNYLPILESTL
jgi:hypothetical protein